MREERECMRASRKRSAPNFTCTYPSAIGVTKGHDIPIRRPVPCHSPVRSAAGTNRMVEARCEVGRSVQEVRRLEVWGCDWLEKACWWWSLFLRSVDFIAPTSSLWSGVGRVWEMFFIGKGHVLSGGDCMMFLGKMVLTLACVHGCFQTKPTAMNQAKKTVPLTA